MEVRKLTLLVCFFWDCVLFLWLCDCPMARLSELLWSSTGSSSVCTSVGRLAFLRMQGWSDIKVCPNPWYVNIILTKTDSSIWLSLDMAFHLSSEVSVKWHMQHIRFELNVDSWSCAFFMDICLDCISALRAMQMECKYFGSSFWITPFVCYFPGSWRLLNEILNLLIVTGLTKSSRCFFQTQIS